MPVSHRGRKPKPLEERFWAKVDRNGPVVRAGLGRCWLWTAAPHSGGYGLILSEYDDRKKRYIVDKAHRVSFKLHYGPFNNELFVLHKCDNPRCVNPEHLELGSNQKNILDAITRGCKAVGVNHPQTTLTKDIVTAINHLRDMKFTHALIGNELGLQRQHVGKVLRSAHYAPEIPSQSHTRLVAHKLTAEQVRQIRAYDRTHSNAKLARMFGVGASTIHYARTGASWKHLL